MVSVELTPATVAKVEEGRWSRSSSWRVLDVVTLLPHSPDVRVEHEWNIVDSKTRRFSWTQVVVSAVDNDEGLDTSGLAIIITDCGTASSLLSTFEDSIQLLQLLTNSGDSVFCSYLFIVQCGGMVARFLNDIAQDLISVFESSGGAIIF